MSKKCRAYSRSELGLEQPDNRKAFYAGWDAALAEQPAQEPVEEFAYKAITKRGEHCHFGTHAAARIWAGKGGEVETIKLRHLELAEQPAQQQEPVAFVNADQLQGLTLGHYGYVEIYTDESAGRVPLYTSPQPSKPWVGLTDDDIQEVRENCGVTHHAIKTIEAKLREKNNG